MMLCLLYNQDWSYTTILSIVPHARSNFHDVSDLNAIGSPEPQGSTKLVVRKGFSRGSLENTLMVINTDIDSLSVQLARKGLHF